MRTYVPFLLPTNLRPIQIISTQISDKQIGNSRVELDRKEEASTINYF
jgi:hypothetical protein